MSFSQIDRIDSRPFGAFPYAFVGEEGWELTFAPSTGGVGPFTVQIVAYGNSAPPFDQPLTTGVLKEELYLMPDISGSSYIVTDATARTLTDVTHGTSPRFKIVCPAPVPNQPGSSWFRIVVIDTGDSNNYHTYTVQAEVMDTDAYIYTQFGNTLSGGATLDTRGLAAADNYVIYYPNVFSGAADTAPSSTDTVTWELTNPTGTFSPYFYGAGTTVITNRGQGFQNRISVVIPAGSTDHDTVELRVTDEQYPYITSYHLIKVHRTETKDNSISLDVSDSTKYSLEAPINQLAYLRLNGDVDSQSVLNNGLPSRWSGGYWKVEPQSTLSGMTFSIDGNNLAALPEVPNDHTSPYSKTVNIGGTWGTGGAFFKFFPFYSQDDLVSVWVDFAVGTGVEATITTPASSTLAQKATGESFSITFGASGPPQHAASFVWNYSGLPLGCTFTPTGPTNQLAVLSGPATVAGTYNNINLSISDGGSYTSPVRTFNQVITSGTVSFTQVTTPTGEQEQVVIDPNIAGKTLWLLGSGFVSGWKAVLYYSGGSLTQSGFLCTTTSTAADKMIVQTPICAGAVGIGSVLIYDGSQPLPSYGVRKAQRSDSITFSASGSIPVLTSLNPNSKAAGSGTFPLVVSGTNFNAQCKVFWNGVEKTTTGSGPLTATILDGDIAVAGTATVTVKNTTTGQLSSNSLPFTIGSPTLTITPGASDQVTIYDLSVTRDAAYSQDLTGSGGSGNYSFIVDPSSADPLPSGITLNTVANVGQLRSTQVTGSTSVVTIKMTDTSNSNSIIRKYRFNVSGGNPQITTVSLPDAQIGVAYNLALLVTGGTPPYTWSSSVGVLPDNMSWSNSTTGVLSGTPTNSNQVTQPGVPAFPLNFSLIDGAANTATKQFNLTLKAAQSTVTVSQILPSSGPTGGGTQVTISDTTPGASKFIAGCIVRFGSASATNVIVVIGGKSLTCFTPSNSAGYINVSVTNPDGGVGTAPNGFRYSTIVVPVISSIDKPDGPFSGGRSIVLSGTHFDGSTEVRIGTVLCTDFVLVSDTTITCTTPAYPEGVQATKVSSDVFVTNSAGTGSLQGGYVYRPAPTIDSITPSQSSTLGGTTAFITGTNFFSRNGVKPRVFIGGIEVPPSDVEIVGGE